MVIIVYSFRLDVAKNTIAEIIKITAISEKSPNGDRKDENSHNTPTSPPKRTRHPQKLLLLSGILGLPISVILRRLGLPLVGFLLGLVNLFRLQFSFQ